MKNTKFNQAYMQIIKEMNENSLQIEPSNIKSNLKPLQKNDEVLSIDRINTLDVAEDQISVLGDYGIDKVIIFCLRLRIAKPRLAQQLRIDLERSVSLMSDTDDQDSADYFQEILDEAWCV